MPFGRRLLVLVLFLAAVGLPAGVLQAICVGRSCAESGTTLARIPFCPLPDDLKARIAAGYRSGRSPDVLAVTRVDDLWGGAGDTSTVAPAWPSFSGGPSTAVPIVFSGIGVASGIAVPIETGLDAVAPTIAEILGFRRPHPEVRSGRAVAGVATGDRPRLILEVAWKGVGSDDLQADAGAWPFLRSLINLGAGTLDGDTASVPLDPAATLTTIGTGGLPSQHGITGTLLRNDRGQLTRAWGRDAPLSVISTLPDDLDEALEQRPLVGLVATDVADRGIVGGNWYVAHDTDDVVRSRNPVAAAERMLAAGFGSDDIPDLLAVVLQANSIRDLDGALRRIVAAARRAAGGSVAIVVTATGSTTNHSRAPDAQVTGVIDEVEARFGGAADSLVEGATPGGLFLDQERLAADGIPGSAVVEALLALGPEGDRLMADAFQGLAISFARYC